jgi:hypothetical protein
LFFLISISLKASLPTKYLDSAGTFLDVIAFKMTLATSIGAKLQTMLIVNHLVICQDKIQFGSVTVMRTALWQKIMHY